MANTYTYSQGPNHGGPLPASGTVVMDGTTLAQVECGFVPSFVLLAGDWSTDATHIWFNGMSTSGLAIVLASAVGTGIITPYDGTNLIKAGFTVTGNAGTGTAYWIAFP